MIDRNADIFAEMPLLDGQDTWQEWFERLSPAERKEIEGVAKQLPKVGPIEGPQRQAFNSDANITGYGGAAGGGKSALIALLALLSHHRSVFFRYDAKQMSGLIDDIVMFHGTQQGLNRQYGRFYFGTYEGHMLEWGGLGKPGSEMDWRGRAHDLLAADEVTEISIKKLIFLMTWLRSVRKGQRVRAVFTFNPPGFEDAVTGEVPTGRWVIPFFAPWIDDRHPNPAEPGEIRYFFTNQEGESEEVATPEPREITLEGTTFVATPRSRTFIPATVQDNPYQTEEYTQNLLSLEEPVRSQMLLGSFRQTITDNPYQVLPSTWVEEAMERWTPEGARTHMSSVGVDVALGGPRSFTVLAPRHGLWWGKLIRRPGSETPSGKAVAREVAGAVRDGAPANIDRNGVGAAAVEACQNASMRCTGVMVQARKGLRFLPGRPKLYNKRTWLFWVLRLLLNPEYGMNIQLPNDKRLMSDLTAPHYSEVEGGIILVESKKDIRKRLQRSTDDGDAVILSLDNFFEDGELSSRLSAPQGVRTVIKPPPRTPWSDQNRWMLM